LGIDSHDLQVALFAISNGHPLVEGKNGRGSGNADDLALYRFHVLNREGVVSGIGDAAAAALILRVNPVRTDRLNLIEKILFPGQPDGGNQN
jgi:hypothetical protein